MFCIRSAAPRDQSQSRYHMRQSSGILMSEDEKIFQHLDEFCRRIEQMIDMTVTLNQFSQYENQRREIVIDYIVISG